MGSANDKTTEHSTSALDRRMVFVVWMTFGWAAVLVFLCLRKNAPFVYDDTFITLRYARHLAEGHGPVWNLVGEPVEGFSSPLHLLLVAGLAKIGIPLLTAARTIAFISHLLLVFFVGRFVAVRTGAFAGVVAAALVASSWPLLVWDLGGLDAVLFASALAAGVLVTLSYIDSGSRREMLTGSALLGLAAFVRPDGVPMAFVVLCACVALGRPPLRNRLLDAAFGAVVCIAVVAPWEIFRLAYFHAALPNTYYAKVYGVPLGWRVVSGLQYWRMYAGQPPYLSFLLVLCIIAVAIRHRVTRFDAALWISIAAYFAYVVDSGGDHMMAFRFMVPIIPLLAVALVRAIFALGGFHTVTMATAVSLLLGAISWRQIASNDQNPLDRDWAGQMGKEIGEYIEQNWRPGSVVALNVAGTIPYYADAMTYIDMLGLNDKMIASRNPVPMNLPTVKWIGHLKGDAASVLARRPEYVIPRGGNGPLLGPGAQDSFLGDYELTMTPAFFRDYKACGVMLHLRDPGPDSPSYFEFVYYERRDVLGSCQAAKGEVKMTYRTDCVACMVLSMFSIWLARGSSMRLMYCVQRRGTMSLRNGLLLIVSCLPFLLAAGSMANAAVDKPIDKAEECGFVVDQAGLPVAEATLTASAGDFKVSAVSSGDGSFLFSGTSNQPVLIQSEANGFSKAEATIAHLEAAVERKCKHPFYVVLFAGNTNGRGSYMTVNQKDVPKPAKQPKLRKGQ